MRNFFKIWQSFFDTWDSTTSALRGFLIAVVVVMFIGIALVNWLTNLSPLQIGFLVIAILCLILIGLTYFLDWKRKRDVDMIPDLLAQRDQLLLKSVDEVSYEMNDPQIMDDIAKVLNMNLDSLKEAIAEKDKHKIEHEINKIDSKYNNPINNKNKSTNNTTLNNMLLVGSMLDDYNVGLANITKTEQFVKLDKRIKELRQRVPKADINAKINDYMKWSDGLYAVLLSTKHFSSLPGLKELMPARIRATNHMVRGSVEEQTTLLISAVRESIQSAKFTEK